MNINSLTPLILLTFITVLPVQANDSQLVAQGKKCATFIDNRLERLRCFDEAFDTQLPSSQSIQITNIEESKPDQRPIFWHRVVKQEKRRKTVDNFISNLFILTNNVILDLATIRNSQVSVISFTGKEVYSINTGNNSQIEIYLADLSQGIYFVKIKDGSGQFGMKKLVKK